jgi:hypothetical protein
MIYVQRDSNGQVVAIFKTAVDGADEPCSVTDPDVIEFLKDIDDQGAYRDLLSLSDIGLIRVIEDLIEVLVHNNVIRFTDLPEEAQKKIIDRKHAREALDETGIIYNDENII